MPDPASLPQPIPAPAGFGASLRAHWLVRLGTQAVVLGVSPLLLYGAWAWVTDGPATRSVNLGVLAFIGLSLGAVLLGIGTLVVLVGRFRSRGTGPVPPPA